MFATLESSLSSHRHITNDAKTLLRVFDSLQADSCPRTFNFHMHTVCSDGKLTPDELMEQVIDIGLKGFAITDHHTIKGFYRAKAWLEDWRWRHPTSFGQRHKSDLLGGSTPRLFTGVEITAAVAGIEVHVLGYGFAPKHKAIQPYLRGQAPKDFMKPVEAVIRAIQTAGGIAVLAHPARYRLSPESLIPFVAKSGIDGVEAYYAYTNPAEWASCPKNTPVVKSLADQYQLLTTCGTDTHGSNLLRRL